MTEEIIENKCHDYKLDLFSLLWIFISGSFLGVVIETIWCYITTSNFESRKGLIYGPFNLVYGIGALALTIGLYWLIKKNVVYTFIGGAILGAFVEYFCSYFQQFMFGTISWRYDEGLFNIHGRINLTYSIFWGILAVVWIKKVLPLLLKLAHKFSKNYMKVLTYFIICFIVFDSFISYSAVKRMSERKNNIEAESKFDIYLDKNYEDNYLKKIYPNMWFVN